MPVDELTQFVIFRTDLPDDRFVAAWRPFAAGFLTQGLRTITLAGFAGGTQDDIAFVSRNTWPEVDYRRAFPGGLAADGAAGPVAVTQGGVFSVHPAGGQPVATARSELDLTMALLHLSNPDEVDVVITAVLGAVAADTARHVVIYQAAHSTQRYQLAVTVHGPAGSGHDSTAALTAASVVCPAVVHGIFLSGRELMSLTS